MNTKIFLLVLSLFFSAGAVAQYAPGDSLKKEKEPIAIGEIGPASSFNTKGGRPNFGYGAAVEVTPIEDVLELELGVAPAFASHLKETDIDLLFKKPWTLSRRLEFMAGVGPSWSHTNVNGIATNSFSGEAALDFMYWPFTRHQFGFYLEPAYEHGFDHDHENSIGISGGLLIAIP